MIPESILNQILDKIDLVELISHHVPLKKAGRSFKALCPFHHEKTPSFIVNPDKQIFHCFGCGAGGNAFGFIMKQERLSFIEAVKFLAQKSGISLPQDYARGEKDRSLERHLLDINKMAQEFYHTILKADVDGESARGYIERRGIKKEIVDSLKLGFSSAVWDRFLSYARTRGLTAPSLDAAGLVIKGKEDTYYDRFRNRLIFPIFDAHSNVLGFGGRVLDDSLPKYINSPETEIYNKGHNLYGLNFAKEAIKDLDWAFIVEGYIDFLTPFQFGFRNVTASLGTALTAAQLRLLRRYTKNITMVYDGDVAGEEATLRGLDIALEEGMNVRVVELPCASDPDSYIRKEGPEKFVGLLKAAMQLFDYKLGLLKRRCDHTSTEGKTKICQSMFETIAKVDNEIKRWDYLKALSEGLKIDERAIVAEFGKVKRFKRGDHIDLPPKTKASEARPAERLLVALLLLDAESIAEIRGCIEESDLHDSRLRAIAKELFRASDGGEAIAPHKLINRLAEGGCGEVVTSLIECTEGVEDKKKALRDCITWLKREKLKEKLNLLRAEIQVAQASKEYKDVTRLMSEYDRLVHSGLSVKKEAK